MKQSHKNYYIIIAAAILVIAVSCRRTEKEFYTNGKLKCEKEYKGKNLYGAFRLYYETGVIQQEVWYENNLVQGKMKRWYANGTLESVETYADGLKDGLCSYYDEYGNLIEEKNFTRDTLDGIYHAWYPSGIMKIDGKYRMGMFDGKWVYCSETGLVVGEGQFRDGTGILTGLGPMGRKTHEVQYRQNRKDGEEVSFGVNGNRLETRIYRMDSLISVSR